MTFALGGSFRRPILYKRGTFLNFYLVNLLENYLLNHNLPKKQISKNYIYKLIKKYGTFGQNDVLSSTALMYSNPSSFERGKQNRGKRQNEY